MRTSSRCATKTFQFLGAGSFTGAVMTAKLRPFLLVRM